MSTLSQAETQFYLHWGKMARNWGISRTMGEIHALLYITAREWSAEDIMEELEISRGNVSMTLRELVNWQLVYRVHRRGERREFYIAEHDVWTIFNRILVERKRREFDPTIAALDQLAELAAADAQNPQRETISSRIESWREFFEAMNEFYQQFTPQSPADVQSMAASLKSAAPTRVDIEGL